MQAKGRSLRMPSFYWSSTPSKHRLHRLRLSAHIEFSLIIQRWQWELKPRLCPPAIIWPHRLGEALQRCFWDFGPQLPAAIWAACFSFAINKTMKCSLSFDFFSWLDCLSAQLFPDCVRLCTKKWRIQICVLFLMAHLPKCHIMMPPATIYFSLTKLPAELRTVHLSFPVHCFSTYKPSMKNCKKRWGWG